MKKYTFRGGTHLREHKDTAGKQTERMPEPKTVSIPLSQHIGAPAQPVVAVGDTVKVGQVIGEVTAGLGCPVHASISGTVKQIVTRYNAMGMQIQNIVIENDFQHTLHESMVPYPKSPEETTCEEFIDVVRRAGISGLGGATFPTYAKLQSAVGKAERIIINCAECEPYITANHRLLIERGETVISGMELVMRALDLPEGIIAIEDNKPDAIAYMESRLEKRRQLGRPANIRVCVMKTKYPQGDERQIIYALFHKEIPAGKLPADVGCLILNAETASAISLLEGHPAGQPDRDGYRRLCARTQKCACAARRIRAGRDRILRRADPNPEKDGQRRSDDGICPMGPRYADHQKYFRASALLSRT